MLSFVLSLALVSVTVSGQPDATPVKKPLETTTASGTVAPASEGQATSDGRAASEAWSSDYGKALAAARSAGKPVLVIIEKGADAQQRFDDQATWGATTIADMQKQFVLCRVDATTRYGQELAQSFGAYQFPFTAISSRDAMHIAYRHQGAITAQQWQAAAANATRQTHTVLRPALEVDGILAPWGATPAPGNCPNCRYR